MEFLKTIVGRLVTGLIVLGVIAGAISWWTMDDASRQTLLADTGQILTWMGVVLTWPWASFAIVGWVSRKDSNAAGAVLVAVYTLLEAVLLAWLFHWHFGGAATWAFVILGVLVAGAYNLLICDWIAEKMT